MLKKYKAHKLFAVSITWDDLDTTWFESMYWNFLEGWVFKNKQTKKHPF